MVVYGEVRVTTVILVGNGLSISYNPNLAMSPLTDAVLDAFDKGAGADAQTLREFARRAGAHQDMLEAVLGSLDQMSAALPTLRRLSVSGAVGRGARSLKRASDVLAGLYRVGLGHSLEVIDNLAHGVPDAMRPIDAFIGALPDPADVTIATLNYDGILPSRLLEHGGQYGDLAAGYHPGNHTVVPNHSAIGGFGLRDEDNIPRPPLINLHGSIGWLTHPDHGWWRFRVQDLRDRGYWRALREGRTEWTPVVVLTNQDRKSEVVRRYPFDLAYRAFRYRLRDASRLAIIGYGFGDDYLNQVLADELSGRNALPLLVITSGDNPTAACVRTALNLRSRRPLRIIRTGAEGGVTSSAWRKWCTSIDPG